MLAALLKITPPGDRQRVDDLLRPLTPGHAVAVVKTHVELFTEMYALSMPVGVTRETAVTTPYPMVSKPVPAVIRVTMESATPQRAVIAKVMTVDADTLNDMFAAALRERGAASPGVTLPRLGLTDVSRFVFDRQLGLMRAITSERLATRGTERRSERTTITLKAPPKR